MTAAVMPQQMRLGHIQRQTIIQDALQILCFQVVFIHSIGGKEGGRRHLLGVTNDNGIFAPSQHTDCLTGGQLRGLVKYYDVKRLSLGIQILCS